MARVLLRSDGGCAVKIHYRDHGRLSARDRHGRLVGAQLFREHRFLFLQGPPGPFFRRLAAELKRRGAFTLRVVFNAGDLVCAMGQPHCSYVGTIGHWPDWIAGLAEDEKITDIVLYGDCRPYHLTAIEVLARRGIRIHVFEEGYLRPRWITYERNGVNGNSILTEQGPASIDMELVDAVPAPREHPVGHSFGGYVFWNLLYYICVLAAARFYRHYRHHRARSISLETCRWIWHLACLPLTLAQARTRTAELRRFGQPYFLVLLQLETDSQLLEHSRFSSTEEVIEYCIRAYAEAKPTKAALVFKAHPLDPDMRRLARITRECAARHGLADRCRFIPGGKLVPLLGQAVGVVSVNSTACHQALLRAIPTKVLGRAIYGHRPIVSKQELPEFFAAPAGGDARTYRRFRKFLLLTNQFTGSFYTRRGIRQLLVPLAERLLSPVDVASFYFPRGARSAPYSLAQARVAGADEDDGQDLASDRHYTHPPKRELQSQSR